MKPISTTTPSPDKFAIEEDENKSYRVMLTTQAALNNEKHSKVKIMPLSEDQVNTELVIFS